MSREPQACPPAKGRNRFSLVPGHGLGSAARTGLDKIDDLQHFANPALDLGTIAVARNLDDLSSKVVRISQLGAIALFERDEVEPFGICAVI